MPIAKRAAKSKPKTETKSKPKPKSELWSQHVTETSDALSLEQGVFSLRSPKSIAASLKRSAEQSKRRKTSPFQSAMSMLNFYINRAGSKLSSAKRERLDKAKDELRALYGKAKPKVLDK